MREYMLGTTAAVAILSLMVFPVTTASLSESPDLSMPSFQNLKAADVQQSSGGNTSVNDFLFSAKNLCNEDISKNGLCLDIAGKGSVTDKIVAGSGIYTTHNIKKVDLNRVQTLSRGLWSAFEAYEASDGSSAEISFKANASTGIVYIQVKEGASEDSGHVCAYGPLVAIKKVEDAVCVDSAFVIIQAKGES